MIYCYGFSETIIVRNMPLIYSQPVTLITFLHENGFQSNKVISKRVAKLIVKKSLLKYEIKQGSLHDNIVNILHQSPWGELVWQAPVDYRFIGHEIIMASNIQDILKKLLSHYPLQAVFYNKNHVVVIRTRKL